MLNKNTIIQVVNRASSVVGYTIPDLGNLRRQYQPNEMKEVSFEELQKLYTLPGGQYLLKHCLLIKNEEAIKEILNNNVEPEYYYSEEDVKNLLLNGSEAELLDCLDFAPDGVIDMVKNYAVKLEINDIRKRNAILDKTGFNVTKAIEINRETKEEVEKDNKVRRVNKEEKEESEGGTGRRVAPPKYRRIG